MKQYILRILALSGVSIGRCVNKDRLRHFVDRLHPVTTGKALIRMGGDGDGGYLVPDDLDGVAACFSPGVGTVASFEKDLVARGIPCHLADGSIAEPPFSHPLVHFTKKYVGVVEDAATITLDAWVRACAPPQGDLLLQMDIEGAEWPVLLNASDAVLRRFRIIIVELHALEKLIDRFGFQIMFAAFDRLLRQFYVVHIHPNNAMPPIDVGGLSIPRLLEFTFIRRDRVTPTGYAMQFPHPLDRTSVLGKPDLALPAGWYRPIALIKQ